MSVARELQELKELRDSGALTDEEFLNAKAIILGSSSSETVKNDLDNSYAPAIQLDFTVAETKPLAEVNSNTSEYHTLGIDGSSYGPYSLEEMRQFWGEGILDVQSQVSVDGGAWQNADSAIWEASREAEDAQEEEVANQFQCLYCGAHHNHHTLQFGRCLNCGHLGLAKDYARCSNSNCGEFQETTPEGCCPRCGEKRELVTDWTFLWWLFYFIVLAIIFFIVSSP